MFLRREGGGRGLGGGRGGLGGLVYENVSLVQKNKNKKKQKTKKTKLLQKRKRQRIAAINDVLHYYPVTTQWTMQINNMI